MLCFSLATTDTAFFTILSPCSFFYAAPLSTAFHYWQESCLLPACGFHSSDFRPALPSSLELRGLLHVTEQLNEAKQAAILVCLPVLSCLDAFILTCKLTNVSSFPSQPSPFFSLCPFNAFSLKFLRGESLEKIQEVRHLLSITKENKLV